MITKVEKVDEQNIDDSKVMEAAKVIKNGGLVAFPTETVYGLGANALSEDAVRKIFIAKGRPQDNPLIVHVADFDFEPYVKNIPETAKKLAKKFWPGPMTLILEKSDLIPMITSANLETIGIRMPSNLVARKLIKFSGVPIAAPSANISGRPSPTDVERCVEDLDGKVDFILGGENCEFGVESTIIDCTVSPICILRPGRITLEMVREVAHDAYIDPAVMQKPKKDLKPKAPGMKYRHYAPKAPLKIIEGDLQKTIEKINEMVQYYIDRDKKVGIVATDETVKSYKNGIVLSVGNRKDMLTVSHNLFETLRKFDDLDVDIILSESFERSGVGTAVMNRLQKSAGFDIIKL